VVPLGAITMQSEGMSPMHHCLRPLHENVVIRPGPAQFWRAPDLWPPASTACRVVTWQPSRLKIGLCARRSCSLNANPPMPSGRNPELGAFGPRHSETCFHVASHSLLCQYLLALSDFCRTTCALYWGCGVQIFWIRAPRPARALSSSLHPTRYVLCFDRFTIMM
jgi:hypothetical protein